MRSFAIRFREQKASYYTGKNIIRNGLSGTWPYNSLRRDFLRASWVHLAPKTAFRTPHWGSQGNGGHAVPPLTPSLTLLVYGAWRQAANRRTLAGWTQVGPCHQKKCTSRRQKSPPFPPVSCLRSQPGARQVRVSEWPKWRDFVSAGVQAESKTVPEVGTPGELLRWERLIRPNPHPHIPTPVLGTLSPARMFPSLLPPPPPVSKS